MIQSAYISPVYGTGEIIARTQDNIFVRFDNPPGMVHTGKAQVVPVIQFEIKKEEHNG